MMDVELSGYQNCRSKSAGSRGRGRLPKTGPGRNGEGCRGRLQGKRWEETMPEMPWNRREVLKAISAGAATGFLAGGARNAAAQQVKWSEGTEPPKLKAPSNACDCHHHIY